MSSENRGKLFVFSGPSGCGKDTILKEFLKDNEAYLSISFTTRSPRDGEEDGKDYFFITQDEMKRLIADNGVLEYAEYCGNFYGTPRRQVEDKLKSGKNVILEIETVGAANIKKMLPEAVLIFIAPPSMEILKDRLVGRGTDSMEVIEKRLAKAKKEMELLPNYDYCIVNDRIQDAVHCLHCIVVAESCKIEK